MKHFSKTGADNAKVQKLITAQEAKSAPGTALLAAIARTKKTNQLKGKIA